MSAAEAEREPSRADLLEALEELARRLERLSDTFTAEGVIVNAS